MALADRFLVQNELQMERKCPPSHGFIDINFKTKFGILVGGKILVAKKTNQEMLWARIKETRRKRRKSYNRSVQ